MGKNQTYLLPTVILNDTVAVTVEIAKTSDEIKRGLSGRSSLDPENGMLFIFPKPSLYRFWMLDMHFPIDIIWINENSVVTVNANVHTTFDAIIPIHRSFIGWLFRRRRPIFYSPSQPAQYALEVSSGFAARHGIAPGATVDFRNISLTA